MRVFENKVTRRVALGSIAGSLAAGAIFLRYWRGSTLTEADPYGKIEIPPKKVGSDLSQADVERAFEVLQKERAMWLNFRGIAGKIKAVRETAYADNRPADKSTDEGYMSLSLDLQPSAERKMLLPTDVTLVYSDTKGGPPVWSFTLPGRDSRSRGTFTGKELTSISHGELYQFLTLPVSLLTLVNEDIAGILGAWKVSRNANAGAASDSYVFESNGTSVSDGLLPTLGFTNGHLSEYIPKRNPQGPFPVIYLKDQHPDHGIAYPTEFSLSIGAPLADNVSIVVTLSDIEVATS